MYTALGYVWYAGGKGANRAVTQQQRDHDKSCARAVNQADRAACDHPTDKLAAVSAHTYRHRVVNEVHQQRADQ